METLKIGKHRALLAAVTSALALGFAGCGDRQSNNEFGQNLEPGKTAGSKLDQAADAAERKLDQTESAVREETAKASKVVDDSAITTKVKSALVAEPGLKSLGINVDTVAGVVTLRGTADSQEKRQKAELVASTVEGVRWVKNQLVVVPG
jgi:hyperosmotically inducible periplasmic protein